jgi:flagellar hook-basal body complex protein FliE
MSGIKIQEEISIPGPLKRAVHKKEAGSEFTRMIKQAIQNVNRIEKQADRTVIEFLKGKASIHETMIALQKADISLRIFLNFRNKAIEAYKQIMHMQF